MEVGTYVILKKKPDPFEITYFLPLHIFTNEPLLVCGEKEGFFYFKKKGKILEYIRYNKRREYLEVIAYDDRIKKEDNKKKKEELF